MNQDESYAHEAIVSFSFILPNDWSLSSNVKAGSIELFRAHVRRSCQVYRSFNTIINDRSFINVNNERIEQVKIFVLDGIGDVSFMLILIVKRSLTFYEARPVELLTEFAENNLGIMSISSLLRHVLHPATSSSRYVDLFRARAYLVVWWVTVKASYDWQRSRDSLVTTKAASVTNKFVAVRIAARSLIEDSRNLLVLFRRKDGSNGDLSGLLASLDYRERWRAASSSPYSCWNDNPCVATRLRDSIYHEYTTVELRRNSILCASLLWDIVTWGDSLVMSLYTFSRDASSSSSSAVYFDKQIPARRFLTRFWRTIGLYSFQWGW